MNGFGQNYIYRNIELPRCRRKRYRRLFSEMQYTNYPYSHIIEYDVLQGGCTELYVCRGILLAGRDN